MLDFLKHPVRTYLVASSYVFGIMRLLVFHYFGIHFGDIFFTFGLLLGRPAESRGV